MKKGTIPESEKLFAGMSRRKECQLMSLNGGVTRDSTGI